MLLLWPYAEFTTSQSFFFFTFFIKETRLHSNCKCPNWWNCWLHLSVNVMFVQLSKILQVSAIENGSGNVPCWRYRWSFLNRFWCSGTRFGSFWAVVWVVLTKPICEPMSHQLSFTVALYCVEEVLAAPEHLKYWPLPPQATSYKHSCIQPYI